MNTCRLSSASEKTLVQRIATLWWLKFLGWTVAMTAFFQGYFYLLHHPPRAPLVLPLSALDRMIAFSPDWVLVYFSLWLYICLPTSLYTSFRQLYHYAKIAVLLALSGLLCYALLPTTFVLPPLSWQDYALGKILQSIDSPGNVFPSLHVAFAVFSALWLHADLKILRAHKVFYGLNALWCGGIVFSTLAIKQHIVWDVLAGMALGALFGWLGLRNYVRRFGLESAA